MWTPLEAYEVSSLVHSNCQRRTQLRGQRTSGLNCTMGRADSSLRYAHRDNPQPATGYIQLQFRAALAGIRYEPSVPTTCRAYLVRRNFEGDPLLHPRSSVSPGTSTQFGLRMRLTLHWSDSTALLGETSWPMHRANAAHSLSSDVAGQHMNGHRGQCIMQPLDSGAGSVSSDTTNSGAFQGSVEPDRLERI